MLIKIFCFYKSKGPGILGAAILNRKLHCQFVLENRLSPYAVFSRNIARVQNIAGSELTPGIGLKCNILAPGPYERPSKPLKILKYAYLDS